MVNAPSLASPASLEPTVSLRRSRSQEMRLDEEVHLSSQSLHLPQHPQQDYLRYRNELLASLWTAQQQQQASAAALQSMYAQQAAYQPLYAHPAQRSHPDHGVTHRAPIPQSTIPPHAQQPPFQAQRRQEPHHRVYVLRCSHCDSFLSDRSMRAVLLLKPHITLFSTDVAPVNCGPLYGSQDEEPECAEEKVERTCECLTQSLGCFSCGNTVGYQIIAPCNRCTASVTKHSRPANGHRFVFHHNEVKFSERKYFPGEKGVRTDLIRHVSHFARVAPERQPSPSPSPVPALRPTFDGFASTVDSKDAPAQPLFRQIAPRAVSPVPQRSPYGLEEGDTIYWHYLVNSGEMIRAVDPRARSANSYREGR